MTHLSKLLWIVGLVVLSGYSVSSEASPPRLSAGVRELFITSEDFHYGSDGMARIKYQADKIGFDSFTLAFRLSVRNRNHSYVYSPPQRTKLKELQAFSARLNQGNKEFIFKPIIGEKVGNGVIERLTQLRPTDRDLFFATYQKELSLYFNLAAKHGASEVVLGVGMGDLWRSENEMYWRRLGRFAKKMVGKRTRLSIEITSNEDLSALKEWQMKSPYGFERFSRRIDRVRVAGSILQGIEGKIEKVLQLYPHKEVTLSNVTVPACQNPNWNEDEVSCPSGVLGLTAELKAKQANALSEWMKGYEALPSQSRQAIVEIEFRTATTEFEPDEGREDLRFLIDNSLNSDLILKFKAELGKEGVTRGPASEVHKRACVYFDRKGDEDRLGSIHSKMLYSLIGAFPKWETSRSQVYYFKPGDFKNCDVVFYIASTFTIDAPEGFYEELSEFAQAKSLVWMNYRFPTFAKIYNEMAATQGLSSLGFDVLKIEQPLTPPSETNLDPGFYRYFDYKGETFEKAARWNRMTKSFASAPELNLVKIEDEKSVKTLAVARHSKLGTTAPYAVVHENSLGGKIWYIADLPFAYVDRGTPYFILCDLMWDIFNETPPSGPPVALLRLEDINPSQNQLRTKQVINYLSDRGIPFSMAVIPYFSSLFYDPILEDPVVWKAVTEYPFFQGTLRYAKARGASFVIHGVEHMAGDLISGFDGESASDYEFWMYPEDTPHPKDSVTYVLDKLERGEKVFKNLGIKPKAWESPHYAASALDYVLFGKLFRWSFHRPIYFDTEVKKDVELAKKFRMFEPLSEQQKQQRRSLLGQLEISGTMKQFSGQMVPFPVFKDIYGQAVIPETLGFIDYAFFTEHPVRPVSWPDDLILQAKRLRVIRGAYASFFWHVDLASPTLIYYRTHPGHFEKDGGMKTLTKTIEAIQALGYEFRSIEDPKLFPDF